MAEPKSASPWGLSHLQGSQSLHWLGQWSELALENGWREWAQCTMLAHRFPPPLSYGHGFWPERGQTLVWMSKGSKMISRLGDCLSDPQQLIYVYTWNGLNVCCILSDGWMNMVHVLSVCCPCLSGDGCFGECSKSSHMVVWWMHCVMIMIWHQCGYMCDVAPAEWAVVEHGRDWG